jgi:hypothetical protein
LANEGSFYLGMKKAARKWDGLNGKSFGIKIGYDLRRIQRDHPDDDRRVLLARLGPDDLGQDGPVQAQAGA